MLAGLVAGRLNKVVKLRDGVDGDDGFQFKFTVEMCFLLIHHALLYKPNDDSLSQNQ